MIDRIARDRLAESLRHLAAGTISNFEYEDKAHSAISSMRDRHGDPAVWAVFSRVWFLYDDLREHRLRGSTKLPSEMRREVARWVVFLKSDSEYQWPMKSFITLTGCLLGLVTLGLWRYFVRSKYERMGDWTIWPFWTTEQMSQALAQPIYLAGKEAVQPLGDNKIEPRWR